MAPWEVSPPDAPGWLLTALRTPPPPPVVERFSDGERAGNAAHEALNRAAFAISDAREGGRNIVLNRRAWTIGKLIGAGLLDEDRAVDTLYAAARAAGLDGMEAAATIHSAIKAGRRTPLGKRWSK